ncbi:hypothetical protein N7509_010664 [Penicillium cosmopolitanum]|uniref:NmrA-like domain-containing protein n=1 Tax=Penicillium cosmopolitanum TaxID=1131564 RepID=A0A9W9VRT6_9EURO|nr:uncharacterized protein N7509_010664 [Penicillium cosmopolitanum]KAJ5388123.1 hypothetical protein N7509_010664 [Penicillium cosmopolitanum]
MASPIVFVCGATGTQGGALTTHLLQQNIQVHAITRNIQSEAAQKISNRGVSLIEGDFDNEETLRKAMTNCTSIFLNLSPNHLNPSAELDQAKNIISIAKEIGINQIIYTGAMGTVNPERLPRWDPTNLAANVLLGKQSIEKEVRNAGFEHWTILRPGNFMSNFLNPLVRMYQGFVETGKFTTAFTPETILPMVDPYDIGRFAAAAVCDPIRFHGKEVEIASQMMGAEAIIKDIAQATGRDMEVVFLSDEEVKGKMATDPFLGPQLLLRDMAIFVDFQKVKGWNIELSTFAEFLKREKKRVEEAYL